MNSIKLKMKIFRALIVITMYLCLGFSVSQGAYNSMIEGNAILYASGAGISYISPLFTGDTIKEFLRYNKYPEKSIFYAYQVSGVLSFGKFAIGYKKIFFGGLHGTGQFIDILAHGNSLFLGTSIKNQFLEGMIFDGEGITFGYSAYTGSVLVYGALLSGKGYRFLKAKGRINSAYFSQEGDTVNGDIHGELVIRDSPFYFATLSAGMKITIEDNWEVSIRMSDGGALFIPEARQLSVKGGGSFSGIVIPPSVFYSSYDISFLDSLPWKYREDTLKNKVEFLPPSAFMSFYSRLSAKVQIGAFLMKYMAYGGPFYVAGVVSVGLASHFTFAVLPGLDINGIPYFGISFLLRKQGYSIEGGLRFANPRYGGMAFMSFSFPHLKVKRRDEPPDGGNHNKE